ncbi:WD40 repeat-like protein [Rozella allomycis CSF55]|uniref:WD40 repeat-like protein n=1 Tax=Rozella allomycis (strain CSF55) TaxID=988480 RepID=A0A4P9YMI5_ROZAC|nr:WD40 repeat-like protein [Rozella allomycis CSF55]
MSIAGITPKFAFGINGKIKNNVSFVDEQNIIYPSGSNVIIYHIEQKTQKILIISDHAIEITCLALSGNKRFLAVAELSTVMGQATISVLDMTTMRKRRVLNVMDMNTPFTNVVFSHDNKFILASTGEPDWCIFYWSWEKGNLIGQQKISMPVNGTIEQISFHPQDVTHICVTGKCMFKMFRHSESGFKSTNLHKFDTKHYASHMWVSNETVLLGTRDGRFYLSDGGELREDFIVNPDKIEFPLSVLHPFENGFMTGNTNAAISIYEKLDDKLQFRKARDVMTNDQQLSIHSVALSPGHDIISVTLENNQLFGFSLVNTEIPKDQSSMRCSVIRSTRGLLWDWTRSVRIWNYEENTCELVKCCNEEVYSVAMHPSGFYVLVGFSDKLKMMNILSDELRVMKEFPVRACKEVKTAFYYNSRSALVTEASTSPQPTAPRSTSTPHGHSSPSVSSKGTSAKMDGKGEVGVGRDGGVGQLVMSDLGNMLVGGCASGSIKIFKYPLELKAEGKEAKMRDGKQRAQGEQFDYEASMFYTLFMDNPNNASTSDKNVLNESKSHFGASREFSKNEIQILCVQDHHFIDDFSNDSFPNSVWTSATTSHHGGVAIISFNPAVSFKIIDRDHNYILVEILNVMTEKLYLLNIYGPPQKTLTSAFVDTLPIIRQITNLIVMGDFNCTSNISDRMPQSGIDMGIGNFGISG